MQVSIKRNEVTSSGITASSNFGMEFNPKIARMLSEQIYSDPIRAVVREYLCNAFDAHTMVGNKSPVKCVLPNTLAPYWSVRDFGPGLSQEQIMGTPESPRGLFNTYGKSGKDDSNSQIGGFGMGSKAGFAYCKQGSVFTITSWHKGVKKVYSAHMDENQMPNISLMAEVASIEPSGIEIKIPVNSKDINSFVDNTREVCKWVPIRPTFSGAEIDFPIFTFPIAGKDWRRVRASKGGYDSTLPSHVVMGGIGYPIAMHHFSSDTCSVLRDGIQFDVPIGAVELSLSRESLNYDSDTIAYITGRCYALMEEAKAIVADRAKLATTKWQKSVVYSNSRELSCMMNFSVSHKGKRVKDNYSIDNRKYVDKSCGFFTVMSNPRLSTAAQELKFSYITRNSWNIPVLEQTVIVWNNGSTTNVQLKLRTIMETYKTKWPNTPIQFVVIKAPTLKLFNELRAKFAWPEHCEHLHEQVNYVMHTSAVSTAAYSKPVDMVREVATLQPSSYDKHCFNQKKLDLATQDVTYYVPRSGYDVCNEFGNEFGVGASIASYCLDDVVQAHFPSFPKPVIHAIPNTYSKATLANPNLVNIIGAIKKIIVDYYTPAKLQYIANMQAIEKVREHRWMMEHSRYYINCPVYNKSNLKKVMTEASKGGDANAISRFNKDINFLDTFFKEKLELPEPTKKLGVDMTKYPMLALLSGSLVLSDDSRTIISEYIINCEK